MIIYVISFILVIFIGFVCSFIANRQKANVCFLVGSLFILTCVAALRSPSVGIDAANYCDYFMRTGRASDMFSIIRSAPVYALYNKLLYMVFPYEQALLIANAIIISIGIGVFIYNFSDDALTSLCTYIFMYCYFFSFNAMKQYMALALLLLAACAIKKDKLLRCIILTALAAGIHNTAILFVPVMFLTRRNVSKKKLFYTSIIAIACAAYIAMFFEKTLILFAKWFPYFSLYVERYSYSSAYNTAQGRNILLTLFYLAIVILALIVQSNKVKGIKITPKAANELRSYLVPCIFSVALGIVAAKNYDVIRIREYFTIYMVCLIPCLANCFKRYRILFELGVLAILFVPFAIQLAENKSGVLPYTFFWQ